MINKHELNDYLPIFTRHLFYLFDGGKVFKLHYYNTNNAQYIKLAYDINVKWGNFSKERCNCITENYR